MNKKLPCDIFKFRKHKTIYKSTSIFEISYYSIWGPYFVPYIGGYKYFLFPFVYDYNRVNLIIHMELKNQSRNFNQRLKIKSYMYDAQTSSTVLVSHTIFVLTQLKLR